MLRVETDHGFVNDKDFGLVEKRRDDGDALAGAVGEAFDGLVDRGLEVEAGDKVATVMLDVAVVHLKELAGEAEEFPGSQLLVKKGEVGDVGHAFARLHWVGLNVEAGDFCAARSWLHES